MKFLYSDIFPMSTGSNQETVSDCLHRLAALYSKIDIAVGYSSQSSLEELDEIVSNTDLQEIHLIIGMYGIEGMPEKSYRLAMQMNKKWRSLGIGDVNIVRKFKYHGKIYLFYKKNDLSSEKVPCEAVIGSANLGVLRPDAGNLRQYETALLVSAEDTSARKTLIEISRHISDLRNHSENIAAVDLKLIRERNTALTGIESVEKVPSSDTKIYEKTSPEVEFELPLKVPAFEKRFSEEKSDYTKSNINVCYAQPRSAKKPRDWFEMQLTVSVDITRLEGYPNPGEPFFIVTDDGYKFKAHTTSSGNKQFSAVGDELLMGRWLKGRLAAAGIVKPVNDVREDTEHLSMITKEMLADYGRDSLLFKKTGKQALDEGGNLLDIWYLSFDNGNETAVFDDEE